MGKLHLIQNNQWLIEIFKELFVIPYRKENTLRNYLLEKALKVRLRPSAWVVCCPSPIFKNLRCVKFDSMLSRWSQTKGVKWVPRRLQRTSVFPSPHPLSSCKLKKALKLPPHRYLPTPTTFHFLPPPYIFAPISPSSLLFQAISTSSLLCTSPLFTRP